MMCCSKNLKKVLAAPKEETIYLSAFSFFRGARGEQKKKRTTTLASSEP
jgi:hypothetical protein